MFRTGFVNACGGGLFALSMAIACATSSGQGSETHFVCSGDADCAARNAGVCVDSRCVPRTPIDAGSGGRGSSGAPSSGGSGASSGRPGSGGSGASSGGPVSGGSTNVLSHDAGVAGNSGGGAEDASDGSFVYFYSDYYRAIYGVPQGAPRSVLLRKAAATENVGYAFTWDATALYYTLMQSNVPAKLVTAPRSRNGAEKTLVSGLHMVDLIAVDATAIYFTDRDPEASTQLTAIERAPLTGEGSTDAGAVQTLLAGGTRGITALATYGDYVYWADFGPGTASNPNTISRMPKSGGEVETVVGNVFDVHAIQVDQSGVYWLDVGNLHPDCSPSEGQVAFLANGSTAPTALASNLKDAQSFVIARGTVYFAEGGSWCNVQNTPTGSISKSPLSAIAPANIVDNMYSPGGLYFDGMDVYYTYVTDPGTNATVAAVLPR